jgi:putative ABC transport system permease protein
VIKYIVFFYRYSLRNKVSSGIALLSLVSGIIAVLFILIFINHELQFDSGHEKEQRIFRVTMSVSSDGDSEQYAATGAPAGEYLAKDFPGISAFVRFRVPDEKTVFKIGDQLVEETGIYSVNPSVFEIFSYKLVRGNPSTALSEPHSLVITRTFSKRYFGDKDPMNETLVLNNIPHKITGLVEDLPENSHFSFQALQSQTNQDNDYDLQSWFDFYNYTYILLESGSSVEKLNARLPDFTTKYLEPVISQGLKVNFILQPLRKTHFIQGLVQDQPTENPKIIWIFSVVAIFLLVIASLNYMNISITRSYGRNREIGIRKVLGINKAGLIKQLFAETFIITSLAFIISLLLIWVLFPTFNSIAGLQVKESAIINPGFIGLTILSLILVGIIGGVYPSLILASSKPAVIMKRTTTGKEYNRLGKLFLTLQFTMVLIVAIFSLTFRDQIKYMVNADPGFTQSNILAVQLPEGEEYINNILACKHDLLFTANVINVSLAGFGTVPGTENGKDIVEIPGGNNYTQKIMNIFGIDENYIDILDLELIAGRNFLPDSEDQNKNGILVNESLVNELNWQEPLDRKLIMGGEHEKTIIGVVKDFHFSSMHNLIEPAVMEYRGNLLQKMLLKTDRTDPEFIYTIWKKHFPDNVFDYSYLEPFYKSKYDTDASYSRLFGVFSSILLFVAILGFSGMCIMILNQKKKDIGIRLIFGAGIGNIFYLILKDFSRVVLISIVIAVPLSYFMIRDWISGFAYRVAINPDKFILPVIILIGIVLVIVSSSIARTLSANPIKNLRMDE